MSKRLFTNSLIFFVGNIILSFFNYLYNAKMGKLLGPSDYSIIGSLLAFIAILTIPTNAVATVAMRFTAHYHAKNQDGTINTFLRRFGKTLGLIGLGVALLIMLFSGALVHYLKLPSASPIIVMAPVLIFAILLPLNRGILQGLQNFTQAVLNQGIDPLLKLTLGVITVKIGLGINGALGAIVISSCVAYLASFWPLRSITSQPQAEIKQIPDDVKNFSVIALVAFLLATVLMNIDILMVKHYLPPYQAGLYTALSVIGKIILYVTSPITSVMFPMISDLQGRDEKHYRILLQSIVLLTVVGLIGVAGYFLIPNLVVKTLYGAAFLPVAPLLGLFGIVMLLYSLVNLWINYFLSIGEKNFVWWLGLSVIVEIALLLTRHANFEMVVQDLLAATTVGFVLMSGYYCYLKRQQFRELLTGRGFNVVSS